MRSSIEEESTIEAPGGEDTGLEAPPVAAVGFEHRRLKEAVRRELFGHTRDEGRIGRFTVLRRLGAGGMGVVYSAYDDELDRKLAIKLLRTDRRGEGAESRLRREAQAIARLSHPNVIGVFEVGRHGGALFVAMEFVHGQTLREWLAAPRSCVEILDAYRQAGDGLQAAHDAGLVHRDFKPDNVMIGEDGRVRVLDFGLAAAIGEVCDSNAAESGEQQARLTLTGTIMGTPRYMAPEQRQGMRADARSDQYSFCVSLWEALYGETHGQLADRSEPWARPAEPDAAFRGVAVAPAVRKVLLRGLDQSPEARWPSMRELLRALDRSVRRRRRGVWVAMLGTLGIAGVAWLSMPDACPDPQAKLEDVWSRSRIQVAREAVAASGQDLSLGAWQDLERQLDTHAAQWSSALTASCDAQLDEEERLEQRLCLEQVLSSFRELTDALALGMLLPVDALPDPASCGDRERRRARARVVSQRTAPAPPGSEAGLVSDFERGLVASFGSGWHVSTDQIIGGRSTATIEQGLGGAAGSDNAMRIVGEVDGGGPASWGGAMFFPGERPMAPANLSSKTTVSFAARGTPGAYVVMFFTMRTGFQPMVGEFQVKESWTEVRFAIADLEPELYDATGFFIGAAEPGAFVLFIDDVRFD